MTDTTPQPDLDAARKGRFLELQDVADELSTSRNQIYALVRQGELEGVKIGGRGQWRVERDKLEKYIERMYADTRQYIATHPYSEQDPEAGESAELLAASNPHPPQAGTSRGGPAPSRRTPAPDASPSIGGEL
jgi:excisionase family DNA binding protein